MADCPQFVHESGQKEFSKSCLSVVTLVLIAK